FRGTRSQPGPCPAKASDWRLGEPMAFRIEANGKRIYVDSGGTPEVLPPAQIAPVDLAILGVALPDSRKRFRAAVDRLRPKYVLPSHQDDFFASVERGFFFGKLTDFRAVARPFQRHEINSHLILLDYFGRGQFRDRRAFAARAPLRPSRHRPGASHPASARKRVQHLVQRHRHCAIAGYGRVTASLRYYVIFYNAAVYPVAVAIWIYVIF